MRVLVCGGRDFSDHALVYSTLDGLEDARGVRITHIIEGGARGADKLAAAWAKIHPTVTLLTFKADWDAHGRFAGPKRNQRMLDEGKPDLIVAFPGGRGTADMIKRAKAAGVEVVEVRV